MSNSPKELWRNITTFAQRFAKEGYTPLQADALLDANGNVVLEMQDGNMNAVGAHFGFSYSAGVLTISVDGTAAAIIYGTILQSLGSIAAPSLLNTSTGSQSIVLSVADQVTINDAVVLSLPFYPKRYTVAGLPSASTSGAGAVVFVSNAGGNGPCLAFSNGTVWKRCDAANTTVT